MTNLSNKIPAHNVFELDERLLRELGVPYDFKEYIFNKLNPDLVPEGIPQRWKEVFSKSILNRATLVGANFAPIQLYQFMWS